MENLCFFFLLLSSFIQQSLPTRISLPSAATDQNALLAFKNAITSDPNGILLKNWSTTSVCYWIGVSCSIKHQRVSALNVSGFSLTGTFPPHLGNLTFLRYLDVSSNSFNGLIPSELSRLHRLREMDLGVNSFTGEIPSWLGSLPQLELLRLENNTFSGRIPEEIGNCSSLQILNLNQNRLTGSIPYSIFNLSSIKEIRIMYNELSGSLPSHDDMCSNLPNLYRLALSANQIEGQIPESIWKCRELEIISLSYNRFSGEIPSGIGSLRKLRTLYLGLNYFKGVIPTELGNLSRLEMISIPGTSLTGIVPKQIGNCSSLLSLELKDNYLTGELPQELGNPTFLEFFNVRNNSLSGPIPSSIFNISTLSQVGLAYNQFTGDLRGISKFSLLNLQELYLSGNKLNGEIPSSITNASKLTILSLANNSFCGSMPDFGNLRLLQRLWIWNNNLSGAESPHQEMRFLSSLSNCQYLEMLAVSGNPLNGVLPTSIGNLSTTLESLYMENCNIKGVVPSTIGNLSSLTDLLFSNNELKGFIPPTIGELKELQRLFLYGNQLQGYIPHDICLLSKLGELHMYGNNLTGPIPGCLGDVMSLRDINLGLNKLNSNVPSNFWNLRDLVFLNLSSNNLSGQLSSRITSLKVTNTLDLSHNQFSGNIPQSIDGCQSLQILSLSNNKLEGSIPPSLGKIRGLSTLDLSCNNLSGLIPDSLEGLNFLKFFNVSYNILEGEIPVGGPFVNFTAQSFLNNSAFCGGTKFQVPHCIEKNIERSRIRNVSRLMKYIMPPFILVIIIATIIVLIMVKRRKLKRVETTNNISPCVTWRRISYIELFRGTDSFSEMNLLGKGSFGSVFKGTLYEGLDVAVKVFNLESERVVRSFETECEILNSIRHRNLVQIISCCSSPEFKALILEYMPNGSLEKWLHSENYHLDLTQRLQIAIDVASALEYLHHGYTSRIVHCDIKPSNVLLDEDMVAHLADFGISKLFDDGETMAHTRTLATIGYAAPEYGSEGKVSTNGDVYSYGILLLEIFTKKRPTNDMFSERMSLKEWVERALQDNALNKVVAPDLLSKVDDQHFFATEEECVLSVFNLAMNCLAISPDERINMIDTVAAMKKIKAKVDESIKHEKQSVLRDQRGQH